MVFADTAADDKQVRPEQAFHHAQVFLEPRGPSRPAQFLCLAHTIRRPPLGGLATDLQMTEFGVRQQPAVAKNSAADAGAQRQHDHHA